jgi:hypothetical protein
VTVPRQVNFVLSPCPADHGMQMWEGMCHSGQLLANMYNTWAAFNLSTPSLLTCSGCSAVDCDLRHAHTRQVRTLCLAHCPCLWCSTSKWYSSALVQLAALVSPLCLVHRPARLMSKSMPACLLKPCLPNWCTLHHWISNHVLTATEQATGPSYLE